jgi:creatinine amidohydrolase/Fe(II)-dependent formamide hydrolase-like protein
MALANRQFPTGHGSHATPSEIAVTQWAYPDAIKAANYAPQIAPTGPIRESVDFRARYPDGRMGSDPAQATPEKGGELVRQAAESLLADVADFSAETPPGPRA